MRYKGERVTIQFDMIIPVDCSDEELLEWARFETMANGELEGMNPLVDHPLDAEFTSVKVQS